MDLSKIPEPSESDLGYAKLLMEIVDYEKLTHHDKAHARIIAHLLRHGRVLAEQSDPKNNHRTFTIEQIVEMEQQRLEAVRFFLQFGGNDER
jgi:hypothetical protein